MKKSLIRLLVVLLILALFPFLSWYYLQKGIDYRMEAISELSDFGKFHWLDGYDEGGRFVDNAYFEGKFIIASVVDGNRQEVDLLQSRYLGLIEQFGSRDEVIYLNILPSDLNIYDYALERLEELGSRGFHRNQIVMTFTREEIANLSDVWASEKDNALGIEKYIIFFNDKGIATQIYDFREENRVARLVEHVAMNLPNRPGRTDYSDAIRDRLN
ncbi:MAG: hypothetical protein EA409_08400 [Saprospirales bacterium]|nr:MAG: hypothetical protein EA409_08400 [Saprospirales bacterium]